MRSGFGGISGQATFFCAVAALGIIAAAATLAIPCSALRRVTLIVSSIGSHSSEGAPSLSRFGARQGGDSDFLSHMPLKSSPSSLIRLYDAMGSQSACSFQLDYH